ncbi:MAG: glycosyltransferase [Gemmatimonas sp.]
MKFVLFYHSFVSCWNHGNAHFLRGIARELVRAGHEVAVYEPEDGWSRTNALQDGGAKALDEAARLVPGVDLHTYDLPTLDLDEALDGADVVLVHEWNHPDLVAQLGERRIAGGRFRLFFHDTHHRAITAPSDLERLDLNGYDAVLAFGEILAEVYRKRGWGRNVFVWHEAADAALFTPQADVAKDTDLVWIGNWGDGERSDELHEYLIEPIADLDLQARIHGVRYPEDVRAVLGAFGISYEGWLPNHRAPTAFARSRMTVHVPRRPYVEALPGIPTIRMFEALACGIPLISAPWSDAENLFPAGSYMMVRNGVEMKAAMRLLRRDPPFAANLAQAGLHAIRTRHTCLHRVGELMAIIDRLHGRRPEAPLHPHRQRIAS